jgi:RNA polymerase sigma-70 factor (ECF subfamily)
MSDFEQIYTAYFDRVFAFLMRIIRNREIAEELTQETFYQAYKSFHKYNGNCELFTWLCAIAKNVYLKYLKKQKHETVDIELIRESVSGDPTDQPEIAFQKKVSSETLKRAIKILPQKYRDIVILRIYAELSFAEIGKKVGITENSAKVIFFRAKNMLKEELLNDK